ncbi:MAG: hypothetical protein R2827_06160 [Bdellovibrionales bacterium]
MTTTTSGTLRPIIDVLTRPETAAITDVNQAAYGMGLITFAFAWPLISQVINTTVVPPILAYRFPKKSTLDDVTAKTETGEYAMSDSQVLGKYFDLWKNLEREAIAFENNFGIQHIDAKQKAVDAKHARDQYLWVKWIRTGLEPGDKFPFLPITVKKQTGRLDPKKGVWAIKTLFISLVATAMITGYFVTRDFTVGTGPEDMRIISEMFFDFINNPNALDAVQ